MGGFPNTHYISSEWSDAGLSSLVSTLGLLLSSSLLGTLKSDGFIIQKTLDNLVRICILTGNDMQSSNTNPW